MKRMLYTLWGGMFILCAGLGFIPAGGDFQGLLTGLSVAFFLPPAAVLYLAAREGDRETVKLVGRLCAVSLGATLALLLGNLICAPGSEALGMVLHWLLGVVSAPMFCAGDWALSLFLWACLLVGSIELLRRR